MNTSLQLSSTKDPPETLMNPEGAAAVKGKAATARRAITEHVVGRRLRLHELRDKSIMHQSDWANSRKVA